MTSAETVATVYERLSDSLTSRGIEQWLDARNRYLDGRRPCDLLESEPEKVLEAADAWTEGVYL